MSILKSPSNLNYSHILNNVLYYSSVVLYSYSYHDPVSTYCTEYTIVERVKAQIKERVSEESSSRNDCREINVTVTKDSRERIKHNLSIKFL